MALNQMIVDNLSRGAAKAGEVRANVANPNQRLVWRNGSWEDAGAAPAGTNQLIVDNRARGAAKAGETRTNVGDTSQSVQWKVGTDGVGRWENAGASGAMSAPRVEYSTQSAPAAASAAAPTAGAMSQDARVDSTYRTPLVSRMEQVANPFGTDYQRAIEGQGISTAERQYSQAADRTRAMLASRGLMSGGGTGLEGALMSRAAMEAAGARDRAITGARTDTALRAADFEARRAGAIDAYNRGLMSDAQMLSLLPAQVTAANAQARQAVTNANLAGATYNDQIAMSNLAASRAAADRDTARAQADIARVDAQIKAMAPDQQKQLRDAMIKEAVNKGIISDKEVAAADQLLQRNANEWPEWGKNILRGGLVLGGAALGGIGGFFAGGVGAVPGALAGAAAGAQAAAGVR